MTEGRHERVTRLFLEAREQPPASRAAWLDTRCGDDPELRAEVEALLRDDVDDGFLSAPLGGGALAADLLDTLDDVRAATGPTAPRLERVGPYRIEALIGEGGFGLVYRAEQESPVRRTVALKVLKPGMDSRQVVARFEAERQALAMMEHPNIAAVYDAGTTEDGRPYFAMELVRGTPITSYCDAHRLDVAARLTLFVTVCRAVQHAHRKGVIHRDIKPSNVLITERDGRPQAKVIDFGIAKATQDPLTDAPELTRQLQLVGTPQYMSPEQADLGAADVDTRADVYSLGVVLYELLTSTTPFDAAELRSASFAELRRVLQEVDPPGPRARLVALGARAHAVARDRGTTSGELVRRLAGDLDAIALKALERNRTKRYDAPGGLGDDVVAFLEHRPVVATPPSRLDRLKKLVRRHRVAVGSALSIAAALLIGVALLVVGLVEAERGRRDAEAQAAIARTERERADASAARLGRLVYASLLDTAQLAIRRGRRDDALESLAAAPAPERGFEWALLERALSDTSVVWPAHGTATVRSVAFAPDGTRLVSVGADGSTVERDATTGAELDRFRGCPGVATDAGYAADGEAIVSSCSDGSIRIRDGGPEVAPRSTVGHTPWATRARFGAGGAVVVSAGHDRTVRVWDRETLEPAARFGGYTDQVWGLDVAPSGGRIATSTADGRVLVRDLGSGDVERYVEVADAGCWDVRFSPDERSLATSCADGSVGVWDLESGARKLRFVDQTRMARAVAYHPWGHLLFTAGSDGTIRSYDAETGRPRGLVLGAQGEIHGLAIAPAGDRIAVAGSDGAVHLWPIAPLVAPFELVGHRADIASARWSVDGARVAAAADDGSVRVWSTTTGATTLELDLHAGPALAVDFGPLRRRIVSAGRDGRVRSVRLPTGAEIWSVATADGVDDVRFAPDGRLVASASDALPVDDGATDATVALREAETGVVVRELVAHGDRVTGIDWSPDGRSLVTVSKDGATIVWDASTGRRLHVSETVDAFPSSVAWAPSGGRIAAGFDDGSLRVFDLLSASWSRAAPAHADAVVAVSWSPEADRIATAGASGSRLRIYRADDLEPLLDVDAGTSGLTAAAFSPLGRALLGAGRAGVLRVWETSTPDGAYGFRAAAFASEAELAFDRRLGRDLRVAFQQDGLDAARARYRGARDRVGPQRVRRVVDGFADFLVEQDRRATDRNAREVLAWNVDAGVPTADTYERLGDLALRRADYAEALAAYARAATIGPASPRLDARSSWAREGVAAKRSNAASPPARDALARRVGRYGPRSITLESGALTYRGGDAADAVRLERIDGATYAPVDDGAWRVRFVDDRVGRTYKLVIVSLDGERSASLLDRPPHDAAGPRVDPACAGRYVAGPGETVTVSVAGASVSLSGDPFEREVSGGVPISTDVVAFVEAGLHLECAAPAPDPAETNARGVDRITLRSATGAVRLRRLPDPP